MVVQAALSFGVDASLLSRADTSSVCESFDREKCSRSVIERLSGEAKMSMMEDGYRIRIVKVA